MPVYLLTAHAYRSWSEDHPNGYIQRGSGLQPTSRGMKHYRKNIAKLPPVRFDDEAQALLHQLAVDIATAHDIKLHATSTTPTHLHELLSFRSPACICGVSRLCRKDCPAKQHAEQIFTHTKRKMGLAIATHKNQPNQKWFSRGWDITPIRTRPHFNYLITTYLPKHQSQEGGICHIYK